MKIYQVCINDDSSDAAEYFPTKQAAMADFRDCVKRGKSGEFYAVTLTEYEVDLPGNRQDFCNILNGSGWAKKFTELEDWRP